MSFDTVQAVFLTAAFIVPGFIWSAVVSMMVVRRTRESDSKVREYLTLSCINYGLWSWALFPLLQSEFYKSHPVWTGLFSFVIVFLSPVVLGLLTGYFSQRNTIARLLDQFGLRTIHPTPRAWDYYFSQGRLAWVIVTLKNDSRLYGFFGLQSFAGDDPDSHDLYLEAVYRPNEHGDWVPVEDTAGVWIAADQISAIEFRHTHEVNSD